MDKAGQVQAAQVESGGVRLTTSFSFRPFTWLDQDLEGSERLGGEGAYQWRKALDSPKELTDFLKAQKGEASFETLKPLEHQFLMTSKQRFFNGMTFGELRRCQLDIETFSGEPNRFPDPTRGDDRVIAIGLRMGERTQLLEVVAIDDESETAILKELNEVLADWDPDIIEGHNIFKFDFDFLKHRCRRFKVPCAWGRFGQKATFRNSRLRVAERWIDFPRCDLPGRTIFDTFLAIQLYDVTTRDLPSYTLKAAAKYLGVTTEADDRTYIEPEKIQVMFSEDREQFRAYLVDDLRETEGIAALLLPTYVAQVQVFPMTLQEACLRGTGAKVDLLFLEKYFHANQSIPQPSEVKPYAGAFSKSFVQGVYQNVLHFDVASLYPSLLLHLDRNPVNDSLGVFIPMLKELRTYRLEYKKLAREETDPVLRKEYDARQASYKILINSFYGYLGFGGARFADGDLAAEVTKQGRGLIQQLIAEFERLGCTVLEADTDGIYLASEEYFSTPETLLDKVSQIMPDGIELEFDGRYQSMFCYKAKNYALYDGEKVSIAGSALRSRGMEPILKNLTNRLIYWRLGATEDTPMELETQYREQLASSDVPVGQLAKREYLSQNPEAYRSAVEAGTKSRRASLEVALRLDPIPRMGEYVKYFITYGEKKKNPDWQTARPLDSFDAQTLPYDPNYYLRKLDEWHKRYAEFLGEATESVQGELF